MPDAPLGVIVTGIVAVWSGATVIGWNESRLVAGFALSDSRSPVGELTVGSNGLVTTLADVVADSLGGPVVPNVPYSIGNTSHSPVSMGLSAKDRDAVVPTVEARSGSPPTNWDSNRSGVDPVVVACAWNCASAGLRL